MNHMRLLSVTIAVMMLGCTIIGIGLERWALILPSLIATVGWFKCACYECVITQENVIPSMPLPEPKPKPDLDIVAPEFDTVTESFPCKNCEDVGPANEY